MSYLQEHKYTHIKLGWESDYASIRYHYYVRCTASQSNPCVIFHVMQPVNSAKPFCTSVNFMYFLCVQFLIEVKKNADSQFNWHLKWRLETMYSTTCQILKMVETHFLALLCFTQFDFFNSLFNRCECMWTEQVNLLGRSKFHDMYFSKTVELSTTQGWSTDDSVGISNDLTQLIVGIFVSDSIRWREFFK